MIVIDSGPLVAIADATDEDHELCIAAFADLREPLLIPAPVLGEVGYMVQRQIGSPGEARFLRSLDNGAFALAPLTFADLHRMADLIDSTPTCIWALWTPRSLRSPSASGSRRSPPWTGGTSLSCGHVTSRHSGCFPTETPPAFDLGVLVNATPGSRRARF